MIRIRALVMFDVDIEKETDGLKPQLEVSWL
jgi:hypothetical protein